MRIFNSDGGEVEACGNAARAVGQFSTDSPATIETLGGLIQTMQRRNDGRHSVSIWASPGSGGQAIPLAYAHGYAQPMPVGWEDLANPTAVNVGNPHAIFFRRKLRCGGTGTAWPC